MDLQINNQSIQQSSNTRRLVARNLSTVNLVAETMDTAALDTNELIVQGGREGDALVCADESGRAQWNESVGPQLMNVKILTTEGLTLEDIDSGCFVVSTFEGTDKNLTLPDPPLEGFYFHIVLLAGSGWGTILHTGSKTISLSYFSTANYTQAGSSSGGSFFVDYNTIPQMLSIVFINNQWRTLNVGPFNND